jgi:glutamate 5-kinase
MQTKVQAATLATRQGIDTIVANGKHPEKLYDIIEKKPVGTLFAGKRAE